MSPENLQGLFWTKVIYLLSTFAYFFYHCLSLLAKIKWFLTKNSISLKGTLKWLEIFWAIIIGVHTTSHGRQGTLWKS